MSSRRLKKLAKLIYERLKHKKWERPCGLPWIQSPPLDVNGLFFCLVIEERYSNGMSAGFDVEVRADNKPHYPGGRYFYRISWPWRWETKVYRLVKEGRTVPSDQTRADLIEQLEVPPKASAGQLSIVKDEQ